MFNMSLFWKVSLEMIGSSIRCFESSLTTSVPGNIYTTVCKIQSTDWVNSKQSGWTSCLLLLFNWSFAKVLVWYLHLLLNWKYSENIYTQIIRSNSKKNILEGSTGLLKEECISLFTGCFYPLWRHASQMC